VDIENQGLMVMTEAELSYPDTMHWPEYNGQVQGGLREEINHFIMSTLTGKQYLVPIQSVLRAIAVAEAAQESIKTGKVIDVVCD